MRTTPADQGQPSGSHADSYVRLSLAAQIVDVHPETLRRAIRDGRLTASRTGPGGSAGHYRVRLADLDRWLAGR
ncbi:helix-turn-helix domain-containing protein [Nocardioides cheoyonin]|uniref:helix-turn-helix domain-containing protein n=1 Tax=Nocardioides cheoyonin TaxID=3156615 RepID=UPI003CCC8602